MNNNQNLQIHSPWNSVRLTEHVRQLEPLAQQPVGLPELANHLLGM